MTPTDLEDRLRRDLAAEAARTQATMLRPLTEPDRATRLAGLRLGVPGAGRGARRWLAPAAAAVAVAAVLAGVTLARSGAGGQPGAAASGGVAAGAVPRFYATVAPGQHIRVLIHSSRTGRVVSSQGLAGAYGSNPSITAASNDRMFAVVTASRMPHSPTGPRLYQVWINNRGRVTTVGGNQRLLVPAGHVVDGIALSPDGSKLAIAEQIPQPAFRPLGEIEEWSVEAGRVIRTWSAAKGMPLDPAWLASGRKLGFLWWDHLHYHGGSSNFTARTQERLLNTSAPGPSLLAGSQVIAAAPKGDFLASAELSADGRMLIGSWFRNVPSGTSRGTADLIYGQLGLNGHGTGFEVGTSARYNGAGQEHAADFSCRVLSMVERHHATLLECPKLAQVYFSDGWVIGGPAGRHGRIAGAAW
jgi:hypothetical protein